MLTDVQINKLAEHGGRRWWLFVIVAYAGLIVERLPVVITLKRYGDLKHKAETCDLAYECWRKRGVEIESLKDRIDELQGTDRNVIDCN